MALQLNCNGIIRKKPDNKYEFVIRWFFNDQEKSEVTIFPNPDGKFIIEIKTKNSNEYIKQDGNLTMGKPDESLLPIAMPYNYLMISPPQNGQIPVNPIDPNDEGVSGLGIYHILTATKTSYYSKKIQKRTIQAISSRKSFLSHSLFSNISIEDYARDFTRYLLENRIKPRTLQAIYIREIGRLEEITFNNSKALRESPLPTLFTFHLPLLKIEKKNRKLNLQSAWKNATLLKEIFKDIQYLKEIEEEIKNPEDLKSQFTLLGLQGIDIIDFWCNPKISSSVRIEDECGKQYNANEAIGLGISVGNIDQAKITSWVNSGEEILINVKYIPPTISELLNSPHYDWKRFHDIDLLEDVPAMNSTTSIITNKGTNSLENVVNSNTSCPPDAPKYAGIEYELFLKRILTEFDNDNDLKEKIKYSENIEMGTGDGRIQFKFIKPDPKPFPQIVSKSGHVIDQKDSSIITGINIYGIWEPQNNSSHLMAYFIDQNLNPDIKELKPWLMTRRYSYFNDLKPYFDSANKNITPNQLLPCKSPAFQTPGEVINLEKIIDIGTENEVIYEQMPNRRGTIQDEEVINFSFNIREGFKNQYVPEIPLTWDKFPFDLTMEKNWKPALWKNNTLNTKPQGYRFWASSVDLFGQESIPIPIINIETSNSDVSNIFNFKYRTALEGPPSNTDIENRIAIAYTDNQPGSLEIKWESPFEGTLGNYESANIHGQIINQPGRVEKNVLWANILYLRKAHQSDTNYFEDSQLNQFIDKLLLTLPLEYQNDKWAIGLKELFRHNANWSVYKTFEKITNRNPGNIWHHKTTIQDIDKGFDYMALINFEITDTNKAFWTSNDPKRAMHIIEESDKKFNLYKTNRLKIIHEMPSVSNIAFTDPIVVINKNIPRLIELPVDSFLPAKPVLAIQGINRDQVLSNILIIPNSVKIIKVGDEMRKAVVFAKMDSNLLYTDGQLAMINAALQRSTNNKNIDLTVPQKILLNEIDNLNKKIFEFKTVDNQEYYLTIEKTRSDIVANDMIGFRGLKKVKFRYNSIFSNLLSYNGEAEAIKYQVFQTRIPIYGGTSPVESFQAMEFIQKSPLKYTQLVFNDALPDTYKVPMLVIIKYDDGFSVSELKSISVSNNKYDLEIKQPLFSNSSGKVITISFIVPNQIYEKDMNLNQDNYYEEDLLLPIGGGYMELFIWSIRTFSATGVPSKDARTFSQVFQTSILPPTPTNVSASAINLDEEKLKYSLDSKTEKKWLPTSLQSATKGELQIFPHTYLKWRVDNNLPPDVFLAIERDARKEEHSFRTFHKITNCWELASRIEKNKLSDTDNTDGVLFLKYLSKEDAISLYSWLNNSVTIEVPGEMSIQNTDKVSFIGPESALFYKNSHLIANQGMRRDINGEPVVIDYFDDNEDLNFGMTTLKSYNYRLSCYIDTDPKNKLGYDNAESRYLFSKPTEWTGWIRPSFPKISKIELKSNSFIGLPKADLFSPEVEFTFKFITNKAYDLRFAKSETPELYYRIIMKREIKNSISSHLEKPEGTAFFEIGEFLDIPVISDGKNTPILDKMLERENLKSEISLNYTVEISIIAKTKDNIIIIRKPKIQNLGIVKLGLIENNMEIRLPLEVQISL